MDCESEQQYGDHFPKAKQKNYRWEVGGSGEVSEHFSSYRRKTAVGQGWMKCKNLEKDPSASFLVTE